MHLSLVSSMTFLRISISGNFHAHCTARPTSMFNWVRGLPCSMVRRWARESWLASNGISEGRQGGTALVMGGFGPFPEGLLGGVNRAVQILRVATGMGGLSWPVAGLTPLQVCTVDVNSLLITL